MYMSNIYSYFMQISHVSCIWPSGCPCLFILNTRHNSIEGISFARDLLVTVNPVSSPLMFSCFEIEIGFSNLPHLMFQVAFRQGIFNLQESITMNSALLVNLTCMSAKLSVKSPGWKAQLAAIGVIWISAGNWLTVVTSISRHDLLSWHRPHTKNIKSFCNYVMAIDVNQFWSFICYNH